MWNVLNNYGCTPNKSLTLKFPDESIFTDKSLIRHFIRGYFDGDGCISYANKNHDIPSLSVIGTLDFLNSMSSKLLNKKYKLINNSKINSITKVLLLSPSTSLIFMYILYYGSNIYLKRKYDRYLQFKDCRFKAKALK